MKLWTVTVIERSQKDPSAYAPMYMREFDRVDEMIEFLKELKENGQDMDYVNIFPPNTALSPSLFI